MKERPIRVLVVNDSPVELELLVWLVEQDPRLEVAATATNGTQAVEAACREAPDVIAMDIYMPQLDGLGATAQIMERCPTPIVIVTAADSYLLESSQSFRALDLGALAVVRTPPAIEHPDHDAARRELLDTLTLMSEVKVIHRLAPRPGVPPPPPSPAPAPTAPIQIVAIGASAGGPVALCHLLSGLPTDFPVPLLIVQHMAPGFIEGFAQWLQQTSEMPVHVARANERPLPGHAYLAPTDRHLGVTSAGRLALSDAPPEAGLRPAVAWLFRSVAAVYGARAVGVMLSGMGADGALELKAMRQHGAATIAQDRTTAIVYGMPGAAVQLGAVSHELPIERIPGLLLSLTASGENRA